MIYPDLGAHLLGQGFNGVEIIYYDVPVAGLSVVRHGLYTMTVNLLEGGTEYAASFDLTQERVAELAARSGNSNGAFVLAALRGLAAGQTLSIAHGWTGTMCCRLGSPEQGTRELFVPLIVERVV